VCAPQPPREDARRRVFQSLWLGSRLSPLEHLCLKSFIAHGHAFVLYAYEEVGNVPAGCAIEDARAIIDEDAVFTQHSGIFAGSFSTFSDIFRYELLRTRGGWWVDTDVLCLKRDIPDPPYVFAKENEHVYVCGVLKAPSDSAFLAQASARSRLEPSEIAVSQIGPVLVNALVRELELEDHAWAQQDVYPLNWREVLAVLDPARADEIEARVAPATFMHFYTNMLRAAAILKDLGPPKSSYLDRLYAAYEIELPTDRRYRWEEIEPQYLLQQDKWRVQKEVGRLHEQVDALSAEREQLTVELREAREAAHGLARIEQSVTIQLMRRMSDRFYSVVGRRSPLARVIQASLRLIGRRFIR
jgi:hypothetical protein